MGLSVYTSKNFEASSIMSLKRANYNLTKLTDRSIPSVSILPPTAHIKFRTALGYMVYSTSIVTACVVSATLTGTALGLLLSASRMSICSRKSSSRGIVGRFTCLLCHKKKKKKDFPKRLILVRHGESEGNIDPSLYGHVPDNAMHLTALGYEQAVAAGKSIKKIIGNETMVRTTVCVRTR